MAMSPFEVERKVRQLDNDVQPIYELLHGIQSTQTRHSNRFNELQAQVDGLREQLGGVDVKVDGLGTRLQEVDVRLDGMDGRFERLDAKVDQVLDLLRGSADT